MSSKKKKKEKRREKRVSQKKLAANQANAQLSTGPNTDAGKEKASRNATTFNFYGQKTPVAPWENPQDYEAFKAAFWEELAPHGPREAWLAERVIAESWRLLRVPRVEVMLYEMFTGDPDRLFYELNKLSLNELRMERLRTKAMDELEMLQAERRRKAQVQAQAPAMAMDRRHPASVGAPMRGIPQGTLADPSKPASGADFTSDSQSPLGSFRDTPGEASANPDQSLPNHPASPGMEAAS